MPLITKTRAIVHHRQAGFTLLELLVTLAIFALISVMASMGMRQIIINQQRITKNIQKTVQLQLAMTLLTRDLQAMSPRSLKNNISSSSEPLLQSTSSGIVFITANNPNPAMIAARGIQRQVSYQLTNHNLIRTTWPVASPTEQTASIQQTILSNVNSFHLSFIDSQGTFHNDWPLNNPNSPLNINQLITRSPRLVLPPPNQLPAGIAIKLRLAGQGMLKKIIVISEQYVAPLTSSSNDSFAGGST